MREVIHGPRRLVPVLGENAFAHVDPRVVHQHVESVRLRDDRGCQIADLCQRRQVAEDRSDTVGPRGLGDRCGCRSRAVRGSAVDEDVRAHAGQLDR
jgi:hypothetical protein